MHQGKTRCTKEITLCTKEKTLCTKEIISCTKENIPCTKMRHYRKLYWLMGSISARKQLSIHFLVSVTAFFYLRKFSLHLVKCSMMCVFVTLYLYFLSCFSRRHCWLASPPNQTFANLFSARGAGLASDFGWQVHKIGPLPTFFWHTGLDWRQI